MPTKRSDGRRRRAAGARPSARSSSRRSTKRRAKSARRPAGLRRWLVRILLGLFVVWLLGCYLVVVEPTVNRPAKADAILVLGPPDVDGRVDKAYALARAHYASTVVISVESDLQQQVKGACRNQNPDYQVICFQPDPRTTQGEAREIGQLARAHHWKSIIVVTSTYHISRARMIVERCLPGRVLMVAAPGKPPLAKWAREFLYQSGAYLKAFAKPGC